MQALLPIALRANAVFSASSGVAMTLGAAPIGRFLGIETLLVVIVGICLIGFAAVVALESQRPSRSGSTSIIGADAAWVIASVGLLVLFPAAITSGGRVAIAVVALIVADFGVVQAIGLRSVPTATRT